MSDEGTGDPGAPQDAADQGDTDVHAEPEPKVFDETYVRRLREESARYRTEAKQHAADLKAQSAQLAKFREASMSEQEKAVEAARSEGEKAAAVKYGSRLVDAEVRAAAAGRNLDVPALLEGLDRTRFLNDDGEPNAEAIAQWVDRIAPPAPAKPGFPDLGQGARTTTTSADPSAAMNSLLRSR